MTQISDPTKVLAVPVLESLQRGEIDMQIQTAKKYPRSLKDVTERAIMVATTDEDTAASCLYALPRADKKIEGGSVRLAEIIAQTWTNLRIGARVIGEDAKHVTSQAFCHDLETNVAITMEKKRRITNKHGKRFNEDMIVVTSNAASSIALRDVIFKVVPKVYWKPVLDAARQVAIGDASTLEERRTKLLGYFAKLGVFEDRLLKAIQKASVREITREDLAELKGLAQAIKDGDLTVDAAFPEEPKAGEPAKGRTATVADKAKKVADDVAPTAPPPPNKEEELGAGLCEPEHDIDELRFSIMKAFMAVPSDAGGGYPQLAECGMKDIHDVDKCDDVELLQGLLGALVGAGQ